MIVRNISVPSTRDKGTRRPHQGAPRGTAVGAEKIVTKVPDMPKVNWNEAQKGSRQRFKQAIAYVKAAMVDREVRAVYEKRAAEKNRQPFRVAVSDYLNGNDLIATK